MKSCLSQQSYTTSGKSGNEKAKGKWQFVETALRNPPSVKRGKELSLSYLSQQSYTASGKSRKEEAKREMVICGNSSAKPPVCQQGKEQSIF
mmetsp:Transcript_50433/g.93207  ORF Transcript_50433/g.93207 Transcript_50433/m.93207 type:complete len:92 (+) Transcript_50433:2413-2688(+)